MILLINEAEFHKLNTRQKIPLKCKYCSETFYRLKGGITKQLKLNLNPNKTHDIVTGFCSYRCKNLSMGRIVETTCKQCGKYCNYKKSSRKIRKNSFCSKRCSGIYFQSHKTFGNRRSKLEIWIEKQLLTSFPKLQFIFNGREVINAELDIYLPSLNLAFELNGPFHYEPIYGQETLNRMKTNDERKFQACLEKKIELCIIDTSKQKYFKEASAVVFLEIIKKIIGNKLVNKI